MSDRDNDYISNAFKKVMNESGSFPSFKHFLIIENEIDELSFDLDLPAEDQSTDVDDPAADLEDDSNFADDDLSVNDNFNDLPNADEIEVNLDTDERFKALPPSERLKIRRLSREMSGYELDDELAQAYDRVVGNKPYFTRDQFDDQPPRIKPVRDADAPRTRARSGASHAFKTRRGPLP